MSHAFVSNAAHELQELATEVAWRQWRAIGGSAATKERWRSIVDPEALILVSLGLAAAERRIADVLYSWVEANSTLLSVQRLKNLQRDYPAATHDRLREFGGHISALGAHPRWSSFAGAHQQHRKVDPPEVSRAIEAPTRHATSLLLRLRIAMGVSVKADVLAVALGHDHALDVREITDALSYSPAAVRGALEDLSRAGFLFAVGGEPMTFTAPHREWKELLGLEEVPRWAAWHHWFALVTDLVAWTTTAREVALSEYATDVQLRELTARHQLFFRQAAHELGRAAFQKGVGSYRGLIDSLLQWAQRQD